MVAYSILPCLGSTVQYVEDTYILNRKEEGETGEPPPSPPPPGNTHRHNTKKL